MRLPRLQLPAIRGAPAEYLKRLVPALERGNREVGNAINLMDGEKADKAGVWQRVPGGFDHDAQLEYDNGLHTILDAPPALTAKVVSSIIITNGAAAASTLTVSHHGGAVNGAIYVVIPTIAGYASKFYPYTLVVPPGHHLALTSDRQCFSTVNYVSVPYGPGSSAGDIESGVGKARYDCIVDSHVGTSTEVLVPAPPAGTKRIVRTVTFYNGHAVTTMATRFSIRRISTADEFRLNNYSTGPLQTDFWWEVLNGAVVLDSDAELTIKHNSDPGIYATSAHYLDTAIGRQPQ